MTPPVCPLRVRISAPDRASQTLAVLSSLAVTMREPSGLNDAESDGIGVPLEREDLGAGPASQTFAVLSGLAVTMREPSGLNDAEDGPVCPLRVRSLGAAPGVPDPRRLVLTRGDDPRAVGAERQTEALR